MKGQVEPGNIVYGNLFETFFINEALRTRDYYKTDDKFYYLRTKDDVEIDLIVKRAGREKWAIEIKSSKDVSMVDIKKTKRLADDLNLQRLIFATTGTKTLFIDGAEVMPWQKVLEELKK